MGAEDLNIEEEFVRIKARLHCGTVITRGKGGMGKNARIWSLWRQACFPPGAFGGTMGNRNLVGLGRNGMGLSHLRGLRTTWESSP